MAKRKTKQWFKRGAWWRKIRLNRKHKDRLFRYLFRDKKHLLELYNALHESSYTDPEALEVVTMEDVIFMRMKNDLSFIIDSRLNLYEHQSTWNPNMPLRGLFYFTQQYEGLLEEEEADVYGRKRVALPTPEYIVFCNGGDMEQDRETLYLSDSFSLGRGSGALECTCQEINVRRGNSRELLGKCRRLWEYSEFVSEIGANIRKGLSRDESVQAAMDHCIKRGILTDVLIKEKSEVLHMIFLTEYDEKKHLRHTFEEGREEGIAEGKREGLAEGLQKGRDQGREDKLTEQIQKKLARGKSPEVIAQELEEDIAVIQDLIRQGPGR